MSFLRRKFSGGQPWGVLLGAAVVCALGIADDIWQLDAVTKLAGQAIAAGLMAWKGVQLVSLPAFGVTILSTGVLVLLTVLIVLVTINAVNFVDGLDGLAAGVVGIAASAFFVYTYLLTTSTSAQDYSSRGVDGDRRPSSGAAWASCRTTSTPRASSWGTAGSMLIGLLLASAMIEVTGQVDPGRPRRRRSRRRSSRSSCRSPCSPCRWSTSRSPSSAGPGRAGCSGSRTRCTCTTGCSSSATATPAPSSSSTSGPRPSPSAWR